MKNSPNGNSLNGFLVIDKPKGPSSHQLDFWIKQMFPGTKVGHIGTLDPMATGVLVMALGRAVKLIDVAHEFPKEYVGNMLLHGEVSDKELSAAFLKFQGPVYQLPPLRSAVARNVRIREIYSSEIIERNGKSVLFRVKCESGTYIRTYCTDIGSYLGAGAQLIDLRRTRTGDFTEDQLVTMQDVEIASEFYRNGNGSMIAAMVIPIEFLFRKTPKVVVKESAISNISRGADLYPGGIRAITGNPARGERILAVSESNDIIGTGKLLVSPSEISDLKVVDFDRILIDQIPLKEVRDERKDSMVWKGSGREEVPVQRTKGRTGKGYHGPAKRGDSGNRGEPVRRGSGSERNSHPLRKRKDRRRV